MPLNEHEERILQEIEQRFYDHDPESARRFSSATLPAYWARNARRAALGFVVGLVILVLGLALDWIVGVVGFAIMLGTAMSLIQNMRKIGRHGMQELHHTVNAGALGEAIEEMSRRLRRRFRGGR